MLAEDAEHLRQNVVSKKELKNVLWEEVVTLVKDSPELQTKEIPRTAAAGQKKQSAEPEWEVDDVDKAIKRANPTLDMVGVAVEKFVDVTLRPMFMSGAYTADCIGDFEKWTSAVQDPGCAMCRHGMYVRCRRHRF